MSAPEPGERAKLSKKAVDHARNFLSALFMGLRTAQIHDPANRAFDNAVNVLASAAQELYATTGGFAIQFVEESAFLNGVRLRFADGAFASMRTLRTLLEAKDLGGIEMRTAPTLGSVRKLILLFASQDSGAASKEELQQAQIGLLGVQRFAEAARNIKVDRRIFAAQSYAKLILALREQVERSQQAREVDWASGGGAPRVRAVRVIQDLVELGGDRADFLLRLASNPRGATPLELYAVNTSLLTIALGHGVGLPRQDLVDLGMAALFHAVGARSEGARVVLGPQELRSALASLVAESGLSRSAHLRTLLVAELVPGASGRSKPHWYSRLLQVAVAYQRLVSGLFPEDGGPLGPLEALRRLAEDRDRHYDPRAVDLLINVLRAFPVGAEVVLDGGETAWVASHAGGSRWDRPVVRVAGEPPRTVDLMLREGGRFLGRIQGTRLFLGEGGAKSSLEALGFPPLVDPEALRALGLEDSSGGPGPELAARPAELKELLEALDLPGDEDDPPLVELEPVEAPGEGAPTDPPSTVPIIRGEPLVSPAARVVLEAGEPPSDDLPLVPLSALEALSTDPEPGAFRTPVDPRQVELEPAEPPDLRLENEALRSYVSTLQSALRSSKLPVPVPPVASGLPAPAPTSQPPLRRGRRPLPPKR